jgi:adenine-specific DNA-methyltransferase
MARLEDLIKEIADPRLREQVAREVAKLKVKKKFGLVFEEHLPEVMELPGLAAKPGARVAKRGDKAAGFFLVKAALNGKKVRVVPERGGPEEIAAKDELVVVKRFGEPMYPALIPVDRVTRSPGKPYHTLINAENFHALQLLLYCYEAQVDVIYIDPPYNTGARDWKYNNDYVDTNDQWRHSKWLSMMKKRLELAKRLLKPDGVLICAIDDYEMFHLGPLLEELLPGWDIETAVVEHHPQGGGGVKLSRTHEYALFCISQKGSISGDLVEEEGDEWPLTRSGRDRRNFREGRWHQFYAILIDPQSRKVVGVGAEIPKDAKKYPKRPTKEGYERVYPIDSNGDERVWRYNRDSMMRHIEAGLVFETKRRTLKIRVQRKGKGEPIFTVWTGSRFNAGTHGTSLVEGITSDAAAFSYPKSIYTVLDCVAAAARSKPDAIVLDFFAGSGTTLQAVCLLNELTPGTRRTILVTNNEVEDSKARALEAQGIESGTPAHEEHGVCNRATWPRCRNAVLGHRPDGTMLNGEYIDGGAFADGLQENIAYFKLDFLDPAEVKRGESYEAILPILWMMAGASGELEPSKGSGKHHFPKGCPFCVLLREDYFKEFTAKLAERPDITHVFLVTDSVEAFHEMASQIGKDRRCVQLYKSYLDNFKINLEPKRAD